MDANLARPSHVGINYNCPRRIPIRRYACYRFRQTDKYECRIELDGSPPLTDYTVWFSTTSYTFDGLTGTVPTVLGSSSVVGQALYCLEARSTFQVSEPFSFTSVTFITTPPYNLTTFPTQTYYGGPRLELSITGDGSLPDATLISLQPIPEPGSIVLLFVAAASLFAYAWRRRRRAA